MSIKMKSLLLLSLFGIAGAVRGCEKRNVFVLGHVTCPDGSAVDISCRDSSKVIIMSSGSYTTGNSQCIYPNVKGTLENTCNGKNECQFSVSDAMFGGCNENEDEILKFSFKCMKDPCGSHFCGNGGTCYLDGETPKCNCVDNWQGERCTDNPCLGVACENGGTCLTAGDGSAKCCCLPGYTGDFCTNKVCETLTCNNCGKCGIDETDGQVKCLCTPEHTGPTCDDCSGTGACEAGWEASGCSCYQKFSTSLKWTAAQAECMNQGGNLVEIKTEAEFNFVKNLANGESLWIGLVRFGPEDSNFRYVSTDSCDVYNGWEMSEPSNSADNEFCGEMQTNGNLNDARCARQQGYICEKSRPSA